MTFSDNQENIKNLYSISSPPQIKFQLFVFQLTIVIRTAEEKNLGFGLTPPDR